MDEVGIEFIKPGVMKVDSREAITLMKNTKDHGKIKHIDICHHYIQELVQSGTVTIKQITSTDNVADLFTKPLPCDNHNQFLQVLNIG